MTTVTRPPVKVELTWDGDLRFSTVAGGAQLMLDGNGLAGPSPMQALAASLAGCMAIDVVNILVRGRHPVTGLRATLVATRAERQPARFVAMDLRYLVEGRVPPEAVERAIQLSREKYCSVWHSLRDDIAFTITYEIRE
jgi:putative redox protein